MYLFTLFPSSKLSSFSFLTCTLTLILLFADQGFARSDRREGFNFGTSIGLQSDSTRRNQVSGSELSGRKTDDVRSFSPYVGYSVSGILNLGLNVTMENATTTNKELRTSTNTEVSSTVNSDLKSANIFARLLFGRILYMELGGGLYHNSVRETRQEAVLDGRSINGTREEFNTTGLGPGYHVGLGFEIPVVAGFYFTSAYKQHTYQLRDVKGGYGDLGEKRAFNQASDLSFGVAYYYQ